MVCAVLDFLSIPIAFAAIVDALGVKMDRQHTSSAAIRPRRMSTCLMTGLMLAVAICGSSGTMAQGSKYGNGGSNSGSGGSNPNFNFDPNKKYHVPANLPDTTQGPTNACFQIVGDIARGSDNAHGFDWYDEVMPGWFGVSTYASVTPTSFVEPPTNVAPFNTHAVPIHDLCSGFMWAQRMFLWLNSPSEEGGRVFNSPVFFEVQPPDSKGRMTMVQNEAGKAPHMHVRATKTGPLGLPVLLDAQGRLVSVTDAPAVPLQVLGADGKLVAVARAQRGGDGRLMLLDAASKPIQYAQPKLGLITPADSCTDCVQRSVIDGQTIFVDHRGAVVDVDPGQATGAVLLAQPRHRQKRGSLVYYDIFVNDVFAYFATAVHDGLIKADHFPTSEDDLIRIEQFATDFGKSFHVEHGHTDRGALAVEVKTAWVEADSIPDGCAAITRDAIIPTYDTTDAKKWTPNGETTAKLAMVGMHIVGSTIGHPEMIWSTFENFCNAPNAAYDYITGVKRTWPKNTHGDWIFSAPDAKGPFNQPRAQTDGADIVAAKAVAPSDVLRIQPFGNDAKDASQNAVLADIPQTMLTDMYLTFLDKPSDDIRRHYFLVGATWTSDGGPPGGKSQVGSSSLSNSTMETFIQGKGTNCSSCHQSRSAKVADTGVSHIFSAVLPLFATH